MTNRITYAYLLSPLHTGGTSQEGNLVGIARESHTDLPYLPSSTIRGRLRAMTSTAPCEIQDAPTEIQKIPTQTLLWGNTIEDVKSGRAENLTQGTLWVGDGTILWFPVPSLSHGIVWVTSPLLLRRWLRLSGSTLPIPKVGSFSGGNTRNLYLRDACFRKNSDELHEWSDWKQYVPLPTTMTTEEITEVLVLSDQDCMVLAESSLWRQVRVNLDDHKTVVGGFRYEEAIPPETLMFLSWGVTTAVAPNIASFSVNALNTHLNQVTLQLGGQESLGRGFVKLWSNSPQAISSSSPNSSPS